MSHLEPGVRLYSDLHLEFPQIRELRGRLPRPPKGDIVVLAGDISVGIEGVRFAVEMFPDNAVVYIMGNHEAYHADLDLTIDACRSAAAGTNVRIMERETWDLSPQIRLIAATLWTSYELWGESEIVDAYSEARRLADHRLITTEGRNFSPADARRRHQETLCWLEAELTRAVEEDVRAIVVTHHAPHASCLSPQHRKARDALSAAFANDLTTLLYGPFAPSVWASGHTHHNFNGRVGRTYLASNQGAYPFRGEGAGFKPEGLLL